MTRLGGGDAGSAGAAASSEPVFAVMPLQVLRNIFNLLGLGSFHQMAATGIIIVAAVLLNRFVDFRKGRL